MSLSVFSTAMMKEPKDNKYNEKDGRNEDECIQKEGIGKEGCFSSSGFLSFVFRQMRKIGLS